MVVQVVNFLDWFLIYKVTQVGLKDIIPEMRLLPVMRDSGRKQLSGSRRLMNVKITELTK